MGHSLRRMRSAFRSVPLERERRQPGDGTDVFADLGSLGDAVVGDALVPFLERDAELEAGQVRTDAAVRPGAEGQVPVRLAVRDERVGVRELLRVPPGR